MGSSNLRVLFMRALMVFGLGLCNCATEKRVDPLVLAEEIMANDQIDQQFEEAGVLIDQKQYSAAISKLRDLLKQDSARRIRQPIIYNLGYAHQGLGECQKASRYWEQLLRRPPNAWGGVELQAALFLSEAYLCMNQADRAVAVLVELKQKHAVLTNRQRDIELPMHLAMAYAAAGNRAQSKAYLKATEDGLRRISEEPGPASLRRDKFAEVLLAVARVPTHLRNDDQVAPLLSWLRSTQKYLLQAAELLSPRWSQDALDELRDNYESIVKLITVNHDKNEANRQLALNTQLALNELTNLRLPQTEESPSVAAFFNSVSGWYFQLDKYLASFPVELELTPEAKQRAAIKQRAKLEDVERESNRAVPQNSGE